jgi:hypothetical protein
MGGCGTTGDADTSGRETSADTSAGRLVTLCRVRGLGGLHELGGFDTEGGAITIGNGIGKPLPSSSEATSRSFAGEASD